MPSRFPKARLPLKGRDTARWRTQMTISLHPARVRRNASPGRENEPCNTSGRSAGNIAERCGRRVHPRAKPPDKVVPWVLRLLQSWHPPRHETRCTREGNLSGHARPRPLCSRRCRQYTPVRPKWPPYFGPCRRPKECLRAQIVRSWGRIE